MPAISWQSVSQSVSYTSSIHTAWEQNVNSQISSQSYWILTSGVGGPETRILLQYSCLENPVDGGAWWAVVHRVAQSWGDLACLHALEKEMATHSSVLAWRIPGTEEPGGLPSMGLQGVGNDWSDLAAAAVAAAVSPVGDSDAHSKGEPLD